MTDKKKTKTAEEILELLKPGDAETAALFHRLKDELGLKVETSAGASCHKITYTVQNPKRRLFTLECSEKKFRVKANLFNIAQYKNDVESSLKEIKDSIIKTRACTHCNNGCSWHPPYSIDGESYLPCYGSGHYFANLSNEGWSGLRSLVEREFHAIGMSNS